jgi:hypothetical protein
MFYIHRVFRVSPIDILNFGIKKPTFQYKREE